MISLTTADKALKDIYLEVISEELSKTISPFYNAIEKTAENVNGSNIVKLVPYGVNGGISASAETGALPASGGNKYARLTSGLKNLYGTVEISDKALRASQDSEGAFVNLLSAEMDGLIQSSKANFNRMLFGDGSGVLATVVSNSANVITVDSLKHFKQGMIVDIIDTANGTVRGAARTITALNRSTGQITVDGATIPTISNGTTRVFVQSSRNNELTGLQAIFGTDDIYGLSRTSNYFLNPLSYPYSSSKSLSEQMQRALDDLENIADSRANLIITSFAVRRKLLAEFKTQGSAMNSMELDGGFKAISFNGIPVTADRHCPDDVMYILNTKDFKFHQLSDWRWIENDSGAILRQMNNIAGYSATLVKYGDLMCYKPIGQAAITGITE